MYQLRAISPNLLHAKVTHYMIYTANVCIDRYVVYMVIMHARYASTLHHCDLAQQQFIAHAQVPHVNVRT